MTIDEAIKERRKVIEVQEKLYEEASTNESKEIIKSATDNDRQLVEWLTWLKEAKRLLKIAVPIINNSFPEVGSCWGCANHDEEKDECKGGAFEKCSEVCKWEHADEAFALIGEEGVKNE